MGKNNTSAEQAVFAFVTGIKDGVEYGSLFLRESFDLLTDECCQRDWGHNFFLFEKAYTYCEAIKNITFDYRNMRQHNNQPVFVYPDEPRHIQWPARAKTLKATCILSYLEQRQELRHPITDELRATCRNPYSSRAMELIGLFNEEIYDAGIVDSQMLETAKPEILFGQNGPELYLLEMNAEYSENDQLFYFVQVVNEVKKIFSCVKTPETDWGVDGIKSKLALLRA